MADKTYSFQGLSFSDQYCKEKLQDVLLLYTNLIGINVIIIIIPFHSESKISISQEIPGNCVLRPVKKYLKDNWDKNQHYNSVHIFKLIVVDKICTLKFKCSAVGSRGWAKDHSTRNIHYH